MEVPEPVNGTDVEGAVEGVLNTALTLATEEGAPQPVIEAFASALAMQARQHGAATPEDAPQPVRLPFPRPPFDLEKAWRQITEKRETVRTLAVEALQASSRAKSATEAKKAADTALSEAHAELDELIDHFEEERRASGDEPEQLALPGRQPCAFERDHPGEQCHICSSGGTHEERLELATDADASPAIDEAAAMSDPLAETAAQVADTEHNESADGSEEARVLPRRNRKRVNGSGENA